MSLYDKKKACGYNIQWLFKEITKVHGGNVIKKSNISELLLQEILEGKWSEISLTTLIRIEEELRSIGHKIFDELIK